MKDTTSKFWLMFAPHSFLCSHCFSANAGTS
eukprot:CAMPEP_0168390158 /NCGR_PEP_ID=MMETSP0228-20121227/17331_1 /TAXON_ID=133427 /ORGANISM="Protoceratium reticulatum, Strain CCCM 535 (=CCMP 1889)" /LENGTH=30 /DNA_ID= /DNA_START= /DNA_END= /DNA_ORIENTATION=